LVTILKSEKDIKVVAEAADGKETCELYNELAPDVLLLDLKRSDGTVETIQPEWLAACDGAGNMPRAAAEKIVLAET
jgi:DNA-binding NarL/FixJ family response regulator